MAALASPGCLLDTLISGYHTLRVPAQSLHLKGMLRGSVWPSSLGGLVVRCIYKGFNVKKAEAVLRLRFKPCGEHSENAHDQPHLA